VRRICAGCMRFWIECGGKASSPERDSWLAAESASQPLSPLELKHHIVEG
jgi:hypothetical protein